MAAGSSDDYYALLGVAAEVDGVELRRAWRRLALRFHPDRAGADATITFQKISAAYTVLSDPVSRAAYDRRRRTTGARPPAPRPSESAGSPPPAPVRRAPAVMLDRVSGHLNSLLARGIARRAEEGVVELFLSDAEISEGGMVTIAMNVPVHCQICRGDPAATMCTRCGTRRTVDELFSAWLAVRPGVAEGTLLAPSAELPGMVRPVQFRICRDRVM